MTKTFRSLRPSLARRAPRALGALALLLAVCPGAAQALPLISEVLYDAVGSDDGRLFVELSGVPGTSLDGFTLEGVNGGDGAVGPVLVLTGVIGADGLFVIADRTAAGVTEIPGADLLLNFDLQNGPDSLVLTDGAQAIDAVGYGVFAVGEIFAGEGSPAEDPAAGFNQPSGKQGLLADARPTVGFVHDVRLARQIERLLGFGRGDQV